MVDLKVKIDKLELKNPVTTASGTYGYGEEYLDFMDVNRLAAIFVKGITLENREGNPYPRMAETASGMLNSVGLQNKGVDYFINTIFPRIKHFDTYIIPNVNGSTIEDYVTVASKLNVLKEIKAIELNISCPNVSTERILMRSRPSLPTASAAASSTSVPALTIFFLLIGSVMSSAAH